MAYFALKGNGVSSSRAEQLSTNNAVVNAFALTRATMAVVILATLAFGGFETDGMLILAAQGAAAGAAGLGLLSTVYSLFRQSKSQIIYATRPALFITFDAILAIGVMAVVDTDTSPLAWVALITPVLETAVLFSLGAAGLVWLGLSLAFLALQVSTNVSANASTETLVLAIQQVVAVLLVTGPAALMADSAQERIDNLSGERRVADQTSERLRHVTESAHKMSTLQTGDAILRAAAEGALKIGFDQADVVLRDDDGELTVFTTNSMGPATSIPAELVTSHVSHDVASISQGDEQHGDWLRLNNLVSGHAISLSDDLDDAEPSAILRAWNKYGAVTVGDLNALALLGGNAREAYRTNELLRSAQVHADFLLYKVRHDPLTGIANRAFFLETLEEHLKTRSSLAIFFIDLDGFKAVNDTLGHQMGDDSLVEVASRLQRGAREGEVAGRMGGDEFILLTPITPFDNEASLIAYGEQIVSAISEPIHAGDLVAELGASVGIAVHDGVLDADHIISLADDAMYTAKRRGGGVEFSPDSVSTAAHRSAS